MSHIRASIRITLLVMVSLFFIGIRLLVWPTAQLSRRTDRMLRRGLLRAWGHCFAFVAGLRVEVKGPPPKAPFYMVCNHLSYLDMLVLARQTGCIFVSRGDVEQWPFFGAVARSLYILFINRTDKRDTARVNGLIAQTIAEGDGIVVFPESRVCCGQNIEPFKSPLLQPPIDLDMPVYYATIYYRMPEGKPTEGAICSWWRPEPFYAHLYRFLRYSGAVGTIHFGGEPMRGTDRKELAKRLTEAVRTNFVPLRPAIEVLAPEAIPVEYNAKDTPPS